MVLRMVQRWNTIYEKNMYKIQEKAFPESKNSTEVWEVWTVQVNEPWNLSKQRGENKILTICSLRDQIFCAVNVGGVLWKLQFTFCNLLLYHNTFSYSSQIKPVLTNLIKMISTFLIDIVHTAYFYV